METNMKENVKEEIAKMESVELLERGELIIREGNALELHEPNIIRIAGIIDTPARWLEKRVNTLVQLSCHVLVDREDLKLTLVCDETNHYSTVLSGSMELSEQFRKFGVNNGKYITNFDMAQLFKMNRTCFENQSIAMKLVTELQNFKAKVDQEIEKSDNNRGDTRMLRSQIVTSNLPERFNLYMPIFKGTDKTSFEVEVYINPNDLSCTLISPESNDIIEELRDESIDKVLDRITAVCPDIVIIEQ